jgi:hypothetical protein
MFCYSCNDFFETDIAGEEVILMAPSNNSTVKVTNITFWWDYIDGANSYCLQIVTPSFDAVQILVADTIVTKNNIEFEMSAGEYQWRVKGLNGYYSTPYSYGSFMVDTTTVIQK